MLQNGGQQGVVGTVGQLLMTELDDTVDPHIRQAHYPFVVGTLLLDGNHGAHGKNTMLSSMAVPLYNIWRCPLGAHATFACLLCYALVMCIKRVRGPWLNITRLWAQKGLPCCVTGRGASNGSCSPAARPPPCHLLHSTYQVPDVRSAYTNSLYNPYAIAVIHGMLPCCN